MIEKVDKEFSDQLDVVHAHDIKCRTLHIAAARQLGNGWDNYLKSLLALLHYSDHKEADLYDAQRYLAMTVAIITADSKVSSSELQHLVIAATDAHKALSRVYENAHEISYDAAIAEKLKGIADWKTALGDFSLPTPSESNINEWMNVSDNWIAHTAMALSALKRATLEQLLLTETQISECLANKKMLGVAPECAKVPPKYRALLPSDERKPSMRLSFWDKFQTANGIFPGALRLLVAISIVTSVLFFSQVAGRSTITIYNGLQRTISVSIDDDTQTLLPLQTRELLVDSGLSHTISTKTQEGQLIEQFETENQNSITAHWIYNVASASPLTGIDPSLSVKSMT